ncbi:MAG: hypothetical protein IPK00_15505 [Deltaproteobacteria bacterium]|nr:hypothetical protein [Deltaproteobacteria bacterium]
MDGIRATSASLVAPTNGRGHRFPRRAVAALLAAGLALASCERTPTKAEYVDDRVAVECAGRSGDAFTLCRLEVIKKYMHVPLETLQSQFPAPVRKDRMGCA